MRAINHRNAGFTVVEICVALVIFGVLLAVGIPAMSKSVAAGKAVSASEFYAEGMRLARQTAVSNNAVSRFVLSKNAVNGQFDWQVDVCFRSGTDSCESDSSGWSSAEHNASGDPSGATGFKSVLRSAVALPKSTTLVTTPAPSDATDVYFTPVGWVDTSYDNHLENLDMAPSAKASGQFPRSALAITLAGSVTKCSPDVVEHDARACPQ
ncbi:MAG: type II secretion system protein [Pseudomonadota bacterium]